jgi:hypothetical protein
MPASARLEPSGQELTDAPTPGKSIAMARKSPAASSMTGRHSAQD